MAKKALKKSKRLAARMMLAGAAGNLHVFKEFLVQVGYFDNPRHKDIWDMLASAQGTLRDIRKRLGKTIQPARSGDEVAARFARPKQAPRGHKKPRPGN
jgi:hypothetical protein